MVLHEEHGTTAAFRPREQECLAQASILSPHRGLCQGEFRILCKVLTASSPTGGSSPQAPLGGRAAPRIPPAHTGARRNRPARSNLSAALTNVAFGFRACRNGEWAIAAYGPDLDNASVDERRLWTGFEIVGEETFTAASDDPRFQKWVDRYLMGNWDVEDGPIAGLDAVVKQVNAIAECVVNAPLLTALDIRRVCFPSAQNTHQYQDAHAEVYRLIIDGLNKEAIRGIGDKLGITVKPGDKRTVDALEMLFPRESVQSAVRGPLDRVSEQRRLASHKERPPAQSFPAFEEIGNDIRAVVRGIETVRDDLAERLNVDVARCEERASAMRPLPIFDESRPTQPNYGIFPALEMQGKHVVRVRTGELVSVPGMAEAEALVLEFSDGSLMSIEAATTIAQAISEDAPIKPEALHIRFYVTYVPPMLPYRH